MPEETNIPQEAEVSENRPSQAEVDAMVAALRDHLGPAKITDAAGKEIFPSPQSIPLQAGTILGPLPPLYMPEQPGTEALRKYAFLRQQALDTILHCLSRDGGPDMREELIKLRTELAAAFQEYVVAEGL